MIVAKEAKGTKTAEEGRLGVTFDTW
jgi:hypothetical protein